MFWLLLSKLVSISQPGLCSEALIRDWEAGSTLCRRIVIYDFVKVVFLLVPPERVL